jgi:hypothetical protein
MGPGGTVRGRMHARWGFRHARGREPRNVADAMLRRFYLALSTTGFSMHTFTGVQGLAAPHRAHGPLNDGFSMHTFTEACGELVVWHRVLSTTVFPCTRSQIALYGGPDYAIDLSTTVFPCTRSQTKAAKPSNDVGMVSQRRFFHAHVHSILKISVT